MLLDKCKQEDPRYINKQGQDLSMQKTTVFNQFGKGLSNILSYNQKCLQPGGTPEEFFESISYSVQLDADNSLPDSRGLYRVVSTCYTNQAFAFCPVLVEVIDKTLKERYKGNFLLQVWNDQGEKILENILQYPIQSWNVISEHFMYKLDPREEESEFFYVYYLKKNCSYFKIRDFTGGDSSYRFMTVCNSCFYVANSNTIKIIDINLVMNEGREKVVNVSEKQILSYELGNESRLMGFIENITTRDRLGVGVIVETEDNQIETSVMYFLSRQIEKADIVFMQYHELVPKQPKPEVDPIKKFKYVILKNQYLYGMALRKSGKVDFYWNYQRVSSTEESKFLINNIEVFTDIEVNMQQMFLTKGSGTAQQISSIDLSWGTRISLEVANKLDTMTINEWRKIFYRTIASHFKFFPSYCLINTSFFLAHGKTISLFNIITEKWVNHFTFDMKAVKVFRNEKEEHVYNLGVYQENGRINLIDSDDTTDPEKWQVINNKQTAAGTLISLSSDMEHYRMLYILTNDNGVVNIYGFTRQTLYSFTSLVHDLRKDTIIVPYFSPSERTEFILYNKQPGDIRVYTHYWAKNAEGIDTFYLHLQKQYQISKPSSIIGTVHAAMCTSSASPFLFLVDETNIYKLNTQTKEVKTFQDQNVMSLQLIDNTFCYASVNKSNRRDQFGFYVYDIQQLIDNDLDNNFLLDRTLVGLNGLIDFSEDNQRLSYMVDYDKIQIVPTLHRNVINFMGMLTRDQYICTKRIKDKFIALDRRNQLTIWNIITGKLEGQNEVKGIDYSQYVIYQFEPYDICYKMDWYQPRVLLIQKDPLANMTDEQYFDASSLKTSLKNCTPYTKSQGKKFFNFKLLEILNDKEVKEHYQFTHYSLGVGKQQKLYISDNSQFMLERLTQKAILYKAEKSMYGQIKWAIVRRIQNWPSDLSDCTYANYLCSPDLMYYLDFDKKQNVFIIKDTINQKPRCVIPQGLMNPSQGSISDYPKRFKWIDENKFKVINSEGIEKLIFIQDGVNGAQTTLEEEGYATVPLFNETTGYLHFYFLRKPLAIGDTLERLKAKYQRYKSEQFMFAQKFQSEEMKRNYMYDKLFDVDYSINGCKDKYVADLSFTYLHWRLATMIKNDMNFNLREFDNSQVEMLVYNIFPHCNSVLHYAFKNIELVKQIYECSEMVDSKFEIPIVVNIQGDTVLHLCMDKSNAEYKTAEFLLVKLSNMPFDHHARGIANVLGSFIEQNIPSLGPYILKRFIQTDQIKQVKRGYLNLSSDTDYACVETNIWMDIEKTKTDILVENPIETNIKLEFLDLAKLHCHGSPESESFFQALAKTDDIELFNNRGIQIIIDQKWVLVQEYTIKRLFVPFVIYQLIYFYYSNFIFLQRFLETPAQQQLVGYYDINFYFIGVILLLSSFYFLTSELRQLYSKGFDYLSSIWNYLDIIPPIVIPVLVFSDFMRIRYNFQHSMSAFTALAMWLKFLYFLRIFKSTGYLIRMIVDVIYDMKVFFLVLMIVVLGFTDAFYSLSSAQPEQDNFAGDNFLYAIIYTFRTGLGDFVTDTYNTSIQQVSIWIIFLLASIILLIVLMNLLIAIISESFAEINAVQTQANYQERARIIEENFDLIPTGRLHQPKQRDLYILVGKEIQDATLNPDVLFQINTLRSNFQGRMDSIETKLDKLLESLNKKPAVQPEVARV